MATIFIAFAVTQPGIEPVTSQSQWSTELVSSPSVMGPIQSELSVMEYLECVRVFLFCFKSAPGAFPPLGIFSVLHADLVHLCEEVVRNVLLVIVLGAQEELHPLGRRVCRRERERERD